MTFGPLICLILKESDLHTKRTGHTEFVDKTSEATKPISLEVPKVAATEGEGEAGASMSQEEGICSQFFGFLYAVQEVKIVDVCFLDLLFLLLGKRFISLVVGWTGLFLLCFI